MFWIPYILKRNKFFQIVIVRFVNFVDGKSGIVESLNFPSAQRQKTNPYG